MTTSDWITIITALGTVLVIVFKIGSLHHEVRAMAKTVDRIPGIELTIAQMQVKLDVLWRAYTAESRSPLALNEVGIRALQTTHIDSFAERNYPEVLSRIRAANPLNAYQAQELLITLMNDYQIRDRLMIDLGFMEKNGPLQAAS